MLKSDSPIQTDGPAIPSLRAALVDESGQVSVMYDPSLAKRRLRVRDGAGGRLDEQVHARAADILTALEGAMAPLSIAFLRARPLAAGTPPPRLDGDRLCAGVTATVARAARIPEPGGTALAIQAGLRAAAGPESEGVFDTSFQVSTDHPDADGPGIAAAIRGCSADGARLWALCVRDILGPWLVDGNVEELRLTGRIHAGRDGAWREVTATDQADPAQQA